ncbi:hypothetical protein [Sporosarcina pasteurii]|uniref:Sublancin immunity protein SunI-like PH domain-containing protein n=1 Tax=Sporosarcina pasteurii TaxID=1474 RepID=A0A380BDL7_SPOPA|nr:hypothetical protein [Sporosarcina pasteurii]MDS9472911.1 hypothetical protein [Sporosarcina pasteurii]QBQ06457.1 hypothetical protein E2C16_12600 [Sporosarcina pasteurii]SUI98431.1 Uncharacterised protein [Sporosarcina pasteurii]
MFEVKVEKHDDHIVIKWQFSKTKIPISEIIKVTYDHTYAGESKTAVRIGYPYGTTDRISIQTAKKDYLIFTSVGATKEKILSLLSS